MRIGLLGSAPSSVSLAPFMDKSHAQYVGGKTQAYPPAPFIDQEWNIWPCSPGAFGVVPRADIWFELHRWEPGKEWFSPEYCQFLRDFRGPVYTGATIEEIKNHVVYPLARVEAEFSSFFLRSSLSLMAAVAILHIEDLRVLRRLPAENRPAHPAYQRLLQTMTPEKLDAEAGKDDADDAIGFWGVDMSSTEEYASQKPGCWFFMLETLRRGIKLYLPPESDLGCPEPVYGICEWDHAYIKATARARELNARAVAANQKSEQGRAEFLAMRGAMDDLNYHIKTWISPYRMPHGMFIQLTPGTGLGVTDPPQDAPSPAAPQPAVMQPYTGRTPD